MTKKELRKLFLDKRKKLSPGECAQFNQTLHSFFFSAVDLSFIRVLHTYLPMEKNNEPDTWAIVDRLRREFPHIRISIPRVGPTEELENIFFEGLHQIASSPWGIPEPRQGVPTPIEKIDLVIVPLLAVDQRGNRVGYGRGYYDRMLRNVREDCVKVGLSFFDPVVVIEDAERLDVPIDRCITPQGVTNF
ncbi:MAG: 5-formyltetrahydrofolate cyclo-ligase [Cytophagales bacterium]|nr:5-formyltetrahydrofolate cyclo-ligase [Cytophagales bacterium]